MKIEDYTLMETILDNASDILIEAYQNVDYSEDQEWAEDFERILTEIKSLKESMVFCFKIQE